MIQRSGSFDCQLEFHTIRLSVPSAPMLFTDARSSVLMLLLSLFQFLFTLSAKVLLVLVFPLCQQSGSVVPLAILVSSRVKIDLALVFSICHFVSSLAQLYP